MAVNAIRDNVMAIDKSLTNKQKAFCREYVIDHNGTQAAIRAGYSKKGAEVRASELLRNSKVKDYISRLETEMRVDTTMTVERVQQMYMDAYDLAMEHNQPSAAVSAVTGTARLYGMDKDASLDKQEAEALTPDELETLRKQAIELTKPTIKLNTA